MTSWAVRPEVLAVLSRVLAAPGADFQPSAQLEEVKPTPQGIGVIPLKGLITPEPNLLSMLLGGSGGLKAFRSSLNEAVSSDEIGSIVLNIDSPGGSTDLITETAADIRAAREVKPVVAVANTQAGSGAYWLASQANEVVVTPSGTVGSVGAFVLHVDESKAAEDAGLKPTFISAGKYKVEGNPFEPLGEDAKAHAQQVVDEFYGMFVNDVAQGRGVPAQSVRDGFGEGRMVTAQRAVKGGMADRVDTFEGTIARLANGPAGIQTSQEGRSDKPAAKEVSEEQRARIAEVVTQQPVHLFAKET